MTTSISEIATDIYRISTYTDEIAGGFTFNQFYVDAEEPLLFHTGTRGAFAAVAEALGQLRPVEQLRWISFSHFEADESGAVNEWLGAAPSATVVVGNLTGMISVSDQAERPVRTLADSEVLDLGGKRVRWLDTPHVPHGWDAGMLYEETTGTLFCSDLLSQLGKAQPLITNDVVAPAMEAEGIFGATALTPALGPTLRRLAELQPTTLAIMHGSSFTGDCSDTLLRAAAAYEDRLVNALP